MMNSYTAFLRVRHPSLDPAEVTKALGLTPAHAWAAGSRREAAAGETAHGAHRESYWLAPLGESAWPSAGATAAAWPVAASKSFGRFSAAIPLEGFLLSQVRLLSPQKAFFARLNDEGGTVELSVTLNARDRWAIELPPALLRSLADLYIAVSIEVTGAGEDGLS
jgi:hypothetical protein